jgi:hypothetical protein
MFLSPFNICTRDQDWRASGRRCINEICKSSYIVYRGCRETARQRLVDDGHVAAAISKPRTNRNLARFPGPIRQYVRHLAQRKRVRGGDPEGSFCVTLGFASHLKNSLSIASRGARQSETFPKTAIYCHFGAAKPLSPMQPFHSRLPLEGMSASPGPRAENRERGREEPRCQAVIEGQFVP